MLNCILLHTQVDGGLGHLAMAIYGAPAAHGISNNAGIPEAMHVKTKKPRARMPPIETPTMRRISVASKSSQIDSGVDPTQLSEEVSTTARTRAQSNEMFMLRRPELEQLKVPETHANTVNVRG